MTFVASSEPVVMASDPAAAGGAMPSLCLCMIVKDEAAVIARCLRSVRPIIDFWYLRHRLLGRNERANKGVREVLDGIPGELHATRWVDVGHNQTEAVALAQPVPSSSKISIF